MLGMDISSSLARTALKPVGDQVLIEKLPEFDNPERFGSIILPNSLNLNIRESKIGRVVAVGPGEWSYSKKPVFLKNDVEVGRLVYYTRYGKQYFKTSDDVTFALTLSAGVLAYVFWNGEHIVGLSPRIDRLWCEDCTIEEETTKSGIVMLRSLRPQHTHDSPQDEFRVFRVLHTGRGRINQLTGKRIPLQVIPGQYVWAHRHSGAQVSWLGEDVSGKVVRKKYRLLFENDCILTSSKYGETEAHSQEESPATQEAGQKNTAEKSSCQEKGSTA